MLSLPVLKFRAVGHRIVSISRNQDGTAAVEFAMVAMPFLILLFGVLSMCIAFFWQFSMDNAVWAASRDLRTGVYQTGAGDYAPDPMNPTKDPRDTFKKAICKRAPVEADCLANTRVLVQARTDFNTIQQPNCLVSNNLVDEATAKAAFDAGAASSVVMVTACYAWGFGGKLPMLKLKTINGGAFLIQSSAAFRTEPYN